MNTPTGICISLLGRFCLFLGEHEIPETAFKSRKALSMLKLLALNSRHRLHRDQTMDALWPDLDPAAAAAQMYKSIHYIRKAFEAANSDIAADELLVYRDEMLQLVAPAEVHTDVEAFQKLAQEARRTNSLWAYQRVAASYAGDLLPADIYESWTEELRESLRLQFLELLHALGQKYVEAGSFVEAAEAFRRVLAVDGLDETAHQGLMRVFAMQGSRTQALHQYKRCEEILLKELGVKPSAETIALAKEIRDEKIQLSSKASGPIRVGPTKSYFALHKRSPLIGRQSEMKSVSSLFDDLAQGQGAVLVVQGMAGIGKTRFGQEIVQLAHLRDYQVMVGSAYEGESETPYGAAAEALRGAASASRDLLQFIPQELANAIPEVELIANKTSRGGRATAQSNLFAGVLRFLKALAGQSPVILLLEDLHFADEGTIKLVNYLARNAADFPFLLAGTCRTIEPETSSALVSLLSSLERAPSTAFFQLSSLSEIEHQQLLAQILESGEVDAHLATDVFHLTDGNPLFAIEMVDQLRKNEEIKLQDGVWRVGELAEPYLPPSLQILLAQKWNRLSSKAQSLLNVVAVAGQQTTLHVLERILQFASEEILDLIDETLAARLLKESGLTFRFSHPLFHEAIYQQMSQARRRFLHGQIAGVLEIFYHGDPALPVEALADHHLKSETPKQALPYLISAGERAANLYAHETAIKYYVQALNLDDGSYAVKLHECLGDQLGIVGRELESAEHFEAALPSCELIDARRLRRKAAYRYALAGRLVNAWQHLSAAMDLAKETHDLEWVHLQYVLAHYHWQKNEFDRALTIARESLNVAEAIGAEADAAKAYEMMALCCAPLGDWQHGLEYEAQRLSKADLNRYLADVSDVHL